MIYLSQFTFPDIEVEYDFIMGLKRTCYDTVYPFQVLSKHGLRQFDFETITILYGGNGSGKSTALNVMAEKLGLSRIRSITEVIFLRIIRDCAVIRRRAASDRIRAGSSRAMMCLILCWICARSTRVWITGERRF